MGSGAVIYVPSFIKICSGIQKLIWGDTQTYTQTATWSHKPTLFFQNKESRLKRDVDLKMWNGQELMQKLAFSLVLPSSLCSRLILSRLLQFERRALSLLTRRSDTQVNHVALGASTHEGPINTRMPHLNSLPFPFFSTATISIFSFQVSD
jgi:hypothetical protein